MNLEKEFKRIHDRDAVDQANELLAKYSNDDLESLKKLGFPISEVSAKLASLKEDFYTIKDIEKIAKKYCLRFLPVDQYKGVVPKEVLAKALEVTKTKPYYNRFYILAPVESFELKPEVVDPLLFREVNYGFELIAKWGTDISVRRYIMGLLGFGLLHVPLTLLMMFLIGCLTPHNGTNLWGFTQLASPWYIILVVLGWFFLICVGAMANTEQENWNRSTRQASRW